MRINVYSQELTDEVQMVAKKSNTGVTYHAAQLVLHSSPMLHHPPADDDRSAVTFWLPKSPERREAIALAFEELATSFALRRPKADWIDAAQRLNLGGGECRSPGMKSWPSGYRRNEMRTMKGEFDDMPQCPTAGQRAVKGEWSQRIPLQIDSYATGRQLAHADVLHDGSIEVEVTDGNSGWKVRLQPPPEWNP